MAAIAALIWGINFLKGTDLFTRTIKLYALYDNIDGLVASNQVIINGYRIGHVQKIRFLPDNSGRMIATLTVRPDIFVSKNSVASIISSDFFGGKAVQIQLGNDPNPVEDGDTLYSELKSGIAEQLGPVKDKAESLIQSLDSVAHVLTILLDADARKNLSKSFEHLAVVLNNLALTTGTLNRMISEDGKLNRSISNFEAVSANLKNNNEKVSRIIDNFSQISDSFAHANLAATIQNANKVLSETAAIMQKINKGEGSLGLLLNNDSLYYNLSITVANLDKFLIDLKANPRRYVHFSMFGKNPK